MLIDFTSTHCFEKRHRSIFCFCFLLKRSQNSNVVEAKLILDNESSVPNLQSIRLRQTIRKICSRVCIIVSRRFGRNWREKPSFHWDLRRDYCILVSVLNIQYQPVVDDRTCHQ